MTYTDRLNCFYSIESKIRSKPDSLPSISMSKIKEGEEDTVKAINAAKNSLNGRKLTVPYVNGTLRRMK